MLAFSGNTVNLNTKAKWQKIVFLWEFTSYVPGV